MSTTTAFTPADQATAALFELLENSIVPSTATNTNTAVMFSNDIEDVSKPRQILGESVFNQFVKTEELNQEFPLGLSKLEMPELSPSVGTVSPYELHSSVVESIFSPSLEDSTPLFEDAELDPSNWKSLFEPGEMEIPPPVPAVTSAGSPNFTTMSERPSLKRSSSEAEFEEEMKHYGSSSKRSNSNVSSVMGDVVDEDGIVTYHRKNRQQPLSPIIVETDDPVLQKRARNTEAARRSRARKMERMNQLEDKVDSLKKKNSELEEEVSRLRALLALR